MLEQNDRYVTHGQHCILADRPSHSQYTLVTNSVHTLTVDFAVVLKRKHAYRNSFHSTNEIYLILFISIILSIIVLLKFFSPKTGFISLVIQSNSCTIHTLKHTHFNI
jgi:hypothetical protein